MSATIRTEPFYVTGGTLRQDAPSYVERQADSDLFEGLLRGEFCYVLTSRQMGKSSLMVHTAARLREAGTAAVILDLTAIGQNLSPEQWYGGLLRRLGRQLGLEEELDAFWLRYERLGPLQRWMTALQDVVLKGRDEGRGTEDETGPSAPHPSSLIPHPSRLVIFVDEIDAVRSLRFSTDEFFAGIRECYNRRTQEPEFQRLTFCLLGVAAPADLISDQRTSPFNIGRRIELRDFTEAEAAPLAAGLAASELLHRVLYWTGGQPYLTQRLCQAVAAENAGNPKSKRRAPTEWAGTREAGGGTRNPKSVDRLCDGLFLSRTAREVDDNLAFVRNRLLRPGEADLASLLDLYRKVQRGQRVKDDETNPPVTVLRLSGVVRAAGGQLEVRNRIYERVVDPEWVIAHTPGAELRRQRAAYRRGLWRAAGVSTAVLAVVGSLAVTAVMEARRADRVARREAYQRHLAQEGQRALRQLLYVERVSLAQRTEEEGNVTRAQALLDTLRPEPGQEDLRGFEWRYLWRRCQGDARATWRGNGSIDEVKFSPDGRLLAVANASVIDLRDVATGKVIASLAGHRGDVVSIAFSPDGRLLASGGDDMRVHLWDIAARRQVAAMAGHKDKLRIHAVVFSPDGRFVASESWDKTVRLWDVARRRQIAALAGETSYWHSLAISPDGRILATGSQDGAVRLWSLATRRSIALLTGHAGAIPSLAFSPDGRTLATGSDDSTVKLWDMAHRHEITTLSGHQGGVGSVAFSPDGRRLATGSGDNTIKLWDLSTRQEIATLRGHSAMVSTVAFSPDGRVLVSGSDDTTVKLWNPAARGTITALRHKAQVNSLAFSPDGTALATVYGDGSLRLWDVASRRQLVSLKAHKGWSGSLAFSPDQRLLVTGGNDGFARLWAVSHGPDGRAAGARLRPVTSFAGFQGGLWGLAFSPDGKRLAMQSTRAVKLWDLATRRVVASFKWEPNGPWGLAFSPNGTTLASVNREGTRLWDLATRREVTTLSGADPPVFSPDGRTLATSGSNPSTVKLWDVSTWRTVAGLRRHAPGGGDVAFSPDGMTVAIASASNVLLWNLTIHQEVAVLKGHRSLVIALAFSPDGSTLASGSLDGTVRLWHAATWQEADPLRVIMNGASDQTVRLQWRPLPSALGYCVYRGPAFASRSQLVRLTTLPATAATFTDHGPPLVNGRTQTYVVAPLFPGTGGRTTEGPPATLQLTPVATPPGWIGTSINEGLHPGSVRYDAPTGLLTLRGSGADIWNTADEFYFMSQPVEGNFRITVKALTKPSETDVWAKAGLMVRDTLEPGARDAFAIVTPENGLAVQWRLIGGDECDHQPVIPAPALKLPLTLRLTRQGDTITAAYSRDEGRHFQPAATPLTFDEPLPRTVYAGLCITAHNPSRVTEAKFRGLALERR